jgi:hypothetical protein
MLPLEYFHWEPQFLQLLKQPRETVFHWKLVARKEGAMQKYEQYDIFP